MKAFAITFAHEKEEILNCVLLNGRPILTYDSLENGEAYEFATSSLLNGLSIRDMLQVISERHISISEKVSLAFATGNVLAFVSKPFRATLQYQLKRLQKDYSFLHPFSTDMPLSWAAERIQRLILRDHLEEFDELVGVFHLGAYVFVRSAVKVLTPTPAAKIPYPTIKIEPGSDDRLDLLSKAN